MVDLHDPNLAILRTRLPKDANLEAAIAEANRLVEAWNIEVDGILSGATYCLVIGGRDKQGREVVLRVPMYDRGEALEALHTQIAYSGKGGVEVLNHDPSSGCTLMRRIRPGRMLSEAGLDSIEEVKVCSSIIRELTMPPIPEVRQIEAWYAPFLVEQTAEGIPDDMLHEAQALAKELLETTTDKVLLHADLHHYNILQDGHDWISIDAQGVAGDSCIEPAAFIRNPELSIHERPDLDELVALRINGFAEELGFPLWRVWGWAFAHNVLSWWWCDPPDRAKGIPVLEAIRSARP
jgi:streptomycin 6-kinase